MGGRRMQLHLEQNVLGPAVRKPFMLLSRFLLHTHATPAAYATRSLTFRCQRAFHAPAIRRLLDMEKVNTSERLAALRKLMQERQIDVYSTM